MSLSMAYFDQLQLHPLYSLATISMHLDILLFVLLLVHVDLFHPDLFDLLQYY